MRSEIIIGIFLTDIPHLIDKEINTIGVYRAETAETRRLGVRPLLRDDWKQNSNYKFT
jgi:hypothetical protein